MEIDKDVRRDLVIIYGFLFVLLSALISVAAQGSMLYPYAIADIFIFAILLAICVGLVGLGILDMYADLSYGTRFGLGLLVAIMLGGYILIISSLLFADPTPFKQSGCIIYGLGLLVGIILHFCWLWRVSKKTS